MKFLLILLVLTSCIDKNYTAEEDKGNSDNVIDNNYQNLIQASINNDRLDDDIDFLNEDEKENIFIINSPGFCIDASLELMKYGEKLKFIDYEDIKDNKDIIYIDFIKIEENKDSAFVDYSINYPDISEIMIIFENILIKNYYDQWILIQSRMAVY